MDAKLSEKPLLFLKRQDCDNAFTGPKLDELPSSRAPLSFLDQLQWNYFYIQQWQFSRLKVGKVVYQELFNLWVELFGSKRCVYCLLLRLKTADHAL